MGSDGILDLNHRFNPYTKTIDPTDIEFDGSDSEIYVYLWFPNVEYIKLKNRSLYTPIAAICTACPSGVVDECDFMANFSERWKNLPPSKLRNEEKHNLLGDAGKSLRNCLVVSVAIPDKVLKYGASNPDIAYHSMANIILPPILELHKKIDVNRMHVRLPLVGEQKNNRFILGLTKKLLGATFPKRGSTSAIFQKYDAHGEAIGYLSRLIAWSVGSHYNAKNTKWLNRFEQSIR